MARSLLAYFLQLRALCDERGMLLVVDEAQTGFGRLGTMFGFEHDGVVPDLVAVSKTLGGGVPLAATITSTAIEEDCFAEGFLHVTSHVSDPLPAAAGLAVLDVVASERLVERARDLGDYLLAQLRELQTAHEEIGEVRGRMAPPLTIAKDEVDLAVEILDESLRAVLGRRPELARA